MEQGTEERNDQNAEQEISERYFVDLAAAFVRGKLHGLNQASPLFSRPFAELEITDCAQLFAIGLSSGLKLHKFKKSIDLPRVQNVLGALKSLYAENLLDIGSGRGVFLWPLLHTFSNLEVLSIDVRKDRIDDLLSVKAGGIQRLSADIMDATQLDLPDNSFDVVTALEVLEHMHQAEKAVAEAVRVARRAVIISVPSHEDDNPDHVHLLSRDQLKSMIENAGARPRFGNVLNHMIVVAMKKYPDETP